jgi:Flp pilus assembly protein TadG
VAERAPLATGAVAGHGRRPCETAPAAARGPWCRPARAEDGQATVELVAAIPALLLAALISLQLLAAGYAMTLADGAAEAGALALAEGGSAAEAVRGSLPGWAKDDVSVTVSGEEVSVRLRPPSPFGAIADHLAVTSSASARSAE